MGKAARMRREMRTYRRQVERELKKEGAVHVAASRRAVHEPSRFHEAPADRRVNLEAFDNFAPLRNGLRQIASETENWAGIPMPLDGERLVIEPRYPKAAELMKIGQEKTRPLTEEEKEFASAKIRNQFWSTFRSSEIIVWEKDGKISWGLQPGIHHFRMDLQTMGCMEAWGIEQESNAVHTLAELVSHRQFKQYMLTGMFLESSKRSKVMYCFRRLRPTVALNMRHPSGDVRILCTLCLHPIAYYSGSWAGAMTPTDDVIAHLMLMRGDEPMFWRRANQHAAYRPESGL